ncbi:MAG TPA: NADH-quinone oxidoreductase subunit C [Steroidobacteraceae bacterium]|nr:NADH-quinone oxidoreductase subunit C [Steroidobacteraceae bacterium]
MFKALFGELSPVNSHRGWPRLQVAAGTWREIGEALREGKVQLLAEWGDAAAVHCALFEPATRQVRIASLEAPAGAAPSLARFHPPALRFERAIVDLFGIEMSGLPDARAWLDHGRWPFSAPLAPHPNPASAATAQRAYRFLEAEGPGVHQIPVGPVHAGIIEPGHFRFSASGETVVRLEERLGYTHKGIEKTLAGRSLEEAARIAARVSGDSTAAYSFAFARAVEGALDFEPPRRALWLRGVMAELERVANHLGDIGAICNDAAFAMLHTECAILREETLRTCARAFGHRLMMDRIVPGGVAADLQPDGAQSIRALCERLSGEFPELIELYDNTASLQDRTVATGVLNPALAAEFAAPGYVGRASGRAFDARVVLPYGPYDAAPVEMVVRQEGDVDARVWVRILEVERSIGWLVAALAALPPGPVRAPLPDAPPGSLECSALVEGFRGDILAYVRIAAGRIERCHLRDPSWLLWPLLEAAIEGNIVADFPLCNKSFNCSYSGHDL